ncbi:MAG: hypothetical protein U0183_27575 [Polyangiaceae bacterium]
MRAFACAACSHVDGPNVRSCSACGHPRALDPLDDPMDGPCPRCSAPLQGSGGGSDGVLGCYGCGGTFVTHAGLAELCDTNATAPPFARAEATRSVSEAAYVACPQCHELMARRTFGGRSGLVVDVCGRHGTWFDPTELAAALRVVASGSEPPERAVLEAHASRSPEPKVAEPTGSSTVGRVLRWLLGS